MCKDALAEVRKLIFFFFYLLLSIHFYGTAENTNTIINGKEGSGVVLLTIEAGAYSYSKWVLFLSVKRTDGASRVPAARAQGGTQFCYGLSQISCVTNNTLCVTPAAKS